MSVCDFSGRRTKAHPSTPNKHLDYTRRGWDMLVKIWRKKLHYWDPTRLTLKSGMIVCTSKISSLLRFCEMQLPSLCRESM